MMSKIAIIGGSFSALFTALELAKKGEEILVINSQKDEFESGILTPFNSPALARDGAISSSFMGLVSKKSELDIALCLNLAPLLCFYLSSQNLQAYYPRLKFLARYQRSSPHQAFF